MSVKPINKPKSLGKILNNNNHLRSLISQAKQNTDLLLLVQTALPDVVRSHCHAAHISEQQLVLFTDSPAWVMRLRFCTTQLLDCLHKSHPNVRGVRVRVQLPERAVTKTKRKRTLSEDTRHHLEEMADSLDNPALADALKRLSRIR